MKTDKYSLEIIVGNVGTVFSETTTSHKTKIGQAAEQEFAKYVAISKSGKGRAGGEDVIFLVDGEPYKEHRGSASSFEESDESEHPTAPQRDWAFRSRGRVTGRSSGPNTYDVSYTQMTGPDPEDFEIHNAKIRASSATEARAIVLEREGALPFSVENVKNWRDSWFRRE